MTRHDVPEFRSLGVSRRQALLRGSAGMFALWVGGSSRAFGQEHVQMARGRVVEKLERFGLKYGRERGIAGVMVSNGRDVVVTDEDGRWCLPVRSGDCVFVITPSGFAAPLVDGIPQSFHRHQPAGTPAALGLHHAGVAPTGELPRSIDFELSRVSQPTAFEAALVADTQPGNAIELGYVRDDTLARIKDTSAAFAIHHGDVMGDDLGLFPRYRQKLGDTGISWHHCPGNHDMNLDTPRAAYAFETWKREVGPSHYAFQHGGATFILLNNVEFLEPGRVVKGQKAYRGRIGSEQLLFVRNVLRHVPLEQLVVVSMHIPLQSFEDPNSAADNTSDRNRLLQLLCGRPHTVSFSGHSHTTEHHYFGRDHGFLRDEAHHHHVLTAACGSWWSGPPDERGIPVSDSRDGTPRGFHMLAVDGNRYTTRFVPTAATTAPKLRILVPNARPRGNPLLTRIAFGGGETCRMIGKLFWSMCSTAARGPASFCASREAIKPWK